VLGFLVGVGLIWATAWSRTISKSKDAVDSIAVMMMFMTGGMLLASAVLIAYVVIAPSAFLYFGLALSVGFVTGLGVISVVLWRQ
jgi:hypothetical protein